MTRTEAYFDLLKDTTRAEHHWSQNALRELRYWLGRAIKSCPENEVSAALHRSRLESMLLSNLCLDVNDMELLVGRPAGRFATDAEGEALIGWVEENWDNLVNNGWGNNATFHRVVDYEKLLRIGIRGIIAEIDGYLARLPEGDSRRDFYVAGRRSLEAVVTLASRYRALLLEKAETASEPRKSELLTLADILSRVPENPAATFYEAMQSMWLVQFALCTVDDITLTGRFDNYMYPFYEADLKAGRITRSEALELIEQLYFKHNELYTSWPAAIMVGGVDKEGKTVLNELSYLCIEAIGTTKLVNPSVNVVWRPEMPEDFIDLCMEQISNGYTRPAFFNDELIQQGLRDAGLSPEDARYYINSTCVEITPIGCSDVQVATPYIDLNKAFEYILGEGKALYGEACHIREDISVKLESLTTFDAFKAQLFRCLKAIIQTDLDDVIDTLNHRIANNASPLASTLLNDCLARGMDSGSGGARYSMVYPCFPGFINLIDSLAAVRKAVYEEYKLTLRQLSDACRSDFSDERLRQYLVNLCPKFGNDDEKTDALGVELYDLIRKELENYHTSVGATFHPSYFAWVMHGILGKKASALPDGRKQGQALSEHLGAVQGRDKNGPLAVIRSISHIPQQYGIGGIATNFRFSKGFMKSPEGRSAVKSMIRYFMNEKCFEMQFNVVSQEDLLDAKKHPENYQTLLVRVAGYSDYFVNLDPVIQDEILRRSEHECL